MEAIGTFLMDQVLKMQWLSDLIAGLLGAAGLDTASQWGGTLHFFIYDTIKIVILLCVMIFVISYIQSYFPPERSKRILGRFKGVGGNIAGALLGTVTPFCACSSIPLFIAFEHMGLADQVADFVRGEAVEADTSETMTRRDRVRYALGQTGETFRKVFPFILVGVAVGALIHNWIPQDVIEAVLGDGNPFAVVLATLIGAPIYADIFGTIPIAEALFQKGVGLGTILAFMMSVTVLSIPSLTMLSRVVRPKLLAAFVGVCLAGMIVSGYVFNWLQPFV